MSKIDDFNLLDSEVESCSSCDLCFTPGKHVMYRGSPYAEVFFVGEAPGFHEAERGIPFCGRSGKLLDRMIEDVGFDRDSGIFVANVCKHRPPNNRKPTKVEMSVCFPFLQRQVEIVNPRVIITLGGTATEAILGPGPGITKRRGNWYKYKGISVLPVFHPSYCLRNPKSKTEVYKDLKKVMCFLNVK